MNEQEKFSFEPQRDGLSGGVYRAIKKAIIEGKIRPGERLRQEILAKEIEVSQTTVRDALNQLVGEGLAVRIPYKGVRVATLSAADLKDIYEIRAVLEELAAQSAAEEISREDLDEMRKLLPETFVTQDPASVHKAREANRRFHEIFIRASNRKVLIRTLLQLWDQIDPLMLYSRTLKTDIGMETRIKWGEKDQYQHNRLLNALEASDPKLAGQAARDAVQEAWVNLAEQILDSES